MALIGLKQLDSVLTGSLQVSGSSGVTGSLSVSSNIKASGNISGSVTSTGSFGSVQVAGNAGFREYIYHNGDRDTFIRLQPDEINIEAGGENMISIVEGAGGAQADKVTINNDLVDVDFQVKGDNEANLIRTDAANDRVGIGPQSPTEMLHISGSGTTKLFVEGDISGSVTSTGSFGRVDASGPTVTVAGGSLVLGEEAYSAGANYVGLKTSFHTGSNDYMIISGKSDGSTYISAKDNSGVEIRGGGNRSGNAIVVPDDTFIKLGGSATTLLRPESDNSTDLGSATVRYKDIHLAGDFSGSATSTGLFGNLRVQSSILTINNGSVSGSATSTGSFGRVEANGVVYADSFESVTGGTTIDFNDDVSLTGNLTVSAHISASGNVTGSDIYSSGRIYEAGSSVIDHATAMAIVFGG